MDDVLPDEREYVPRKSMRIPPLLQASGSQTSSYRWFGSSAPRQGEAFTLEVRDESPDDRPGALRGRSVVPEASWRR